MDNEPSAEDIKKEKQRKASLKWRWNNIETARRKDRESKAKMRKKNRGAYNEKMRDYWAKNPKAKIRHLLCLARGRSEKAGLEFNVTVDDLILPTHCPLLFVEINYAASGRKGAQDNSPSIDRIDNSLGYVKGNVWIISWRANRIKSNASIEEIRLIYMGLKEKIDAKK